MILRPPRPTCTATLLPPTSLFRSVLLVPRPGYVRPDFRLVLVVGEDNLDPLAVDRAAHLLRGEPHRGDLPLSGDVGIEAGLVVHHADPDHVAGYLCRDGCRARGERSGHGGQHRPIHVRLSLFPERLRPPAAISPSSHAGPRPAPSPGKNAREDC